METFIHDVRHGFRSLIKSPGLTGAAIVSLALGIGANTTLFTWVKAMLLRPVPGASDPASLQMLLGIALAAAWLPARRASMVDPIVALRCE